MKKITSLNTLNEAIFNGMDPTLTTYQETADSVEDSVRNYLAQHFTAAMLQSDDRTADAIEVLWKRITGKELKS